METSIAEERRAGLLTTLRIQYPDALADRGFRLLHPMTGEPYTDHRRHLVATCRSIANFSAGALVDGPDWCVDAAQHGIEFLRDGHGADDGNGYHLIVDGEGEPLDRTRSAYGHAFVLLAYARATAAGIEGAAADLEATHELLERRFRDDAGMLRSDCDVDWTEREAYRGQNANMHACEAYLAAYEATDDERYLERTRHLANVITVELAAETDGLLWEHYTDEWEHDFEYNADEPRHQFRPPGYQPGHHVEWAKFLALLDRYDEGDTETVPDEGWFARALALFDTAIELGWTESGFAYTVNADGDAIVPDQYGWALAEAIGASAVLAERADAYGHDDEVDRLRRWERRLVDRVDEYCGPDGVWYEKRLAPEDGGNPVEPDLPVVEPDYHPASAYYEGWRSARRVSDRE
ncbi:AGE family epimerase/isomerase [Natrinema sp. SYSU A 869]|uniref:AGE family epimerase/isomerase n=1 Tax=Natrinema sp. SYSU A 869 TaxID=2871694 RepID=UPI001CA4653D|nr:AGE family epimerase/isomerase [Natrinema sp. SYSU A 869]